MKTCTLTGCKLKLKLFLGFKFFRSHFVKKIKLFLLKINAKVMIFSSTFSYSRKQIMLVRPLGKCLSKSTPIYIWKNDEKRMGMLYPYSTSLCYQLLTFLAKFQLFLRYSICSRPAISVTRGERGGGGIC